MSKDKSKPVQKSKTPVPGAKAELSLAPEAPMLSRKIEIAILLVILVGAAVLRLADRDQSPPGLNQDEAANGWNAWCLLKTGKDQAGVPWPITYTRALGSNYTTLNMYLLTPLQAIGGLNVWTTRGTAALGGILTVFLIYFVGKRLLGTGGGLLAAGLLALNPWHLFASRWGIEANICPLLAIAPLSLLLAARMPPCETRDSPHFSAAEKWGLSLVSQRPPCVWLAALAGVVTGLCFYGYPAMLIFLPLFLIALVAGTWRQWWGLLRGERTLTAGGSAAPEMGDTTLFPAGNRVASPISRRGIVAVLAFAITAAAIFAPLAWMHAFHGDEIRKRTVGQWVWEFGRPPGEEYSLGTKVVAVAGRYLDHFGADFLFVSGDHSSIESPPGMGMFHWYMLPLFLLGAAWCIWNFRTSAAARVVLAWVLLYPASDSLGWSFGDKNELCLHSLRSSPGICGLVLLAAAGGAWAGGWLLRRNRSNFWAAACVLALTVAGLNARYLPTFFGEYNRRPYIYRRYHEDLAEACRWLKHRLDQDPNVYDAVFCTTFGMKQPYIIALHELDYDPARWQGDPKVIDTAGMFDTVLQFGKMHFLNYQMTSAGKMSPDPRVGLGEFLEGAKGKKALFILRRFPAIDGMSRGDFDEEEVLRKHVGLASWHVIEEIHRPGDNEVVLKLVEATP